MENPTLKYYREQMEKALFLANKAQGELQMTKMPSNKIYLRKEMSRNKERAEHYVKKMIDHGNGQCVQVQGFVFRRVGDLRKKTKFVMFLNCPSLEDAKEIFEAQVLNTEDFIRDSISYKTIPMKHIIYISQ